MFLLVPAYPGCPGSKAVKRSSSLLLLFFITGGTVIIRDTVQCLAGTNVICCVLHWLLQHYDRNVVK